MPTMRDVRCDVGIHGGGGAGSVNASDQLGFASVVRHYNVAHLVCAPLPFGGSIKAFVALIV
jgi:hypothetical protein